ILERYHWLLRQGGTPGEREEVAELLNSLDMEAARLGVEEGVVLLAKVRQKVLRYRVMKSDSQVTLTGRFLSILRGGSLPVRQLEKELREHFARLRWLGLARDATFMEQEMNQPLEEEQE
ncbi:MAG: hypothetical protein HQL55_08035, partial [Magnetococcales bacterium]|nr:hypothetical protein [Magnetococcales bacterium]